MLRTLLKILLWTVGIIVTLVIVMETVVWLTGPHDSPSSGRDGARSGTRTTRFLAHVTETRWSVVGSEASNGRFLCAIWEKLEEGGLGAVQFAVEGDATNRTSNTLRISRSGSPRQTFTGSIGLDGGTPLSLPGVQMTSTAGDLTLTSEQESTFWPALSRTQRLYLRTDGPAIEVNVAGLKRGLELRENCVRDMQLWLSVPE